MRNKTIDEIKQILSQQENLILIPNDNEGFSRNIKFTSTLTAKQYKIIWYVNKSSLNVDGLSIQEIQDIQIITTWPSKHKKHIAFYDNNKKIIALLEI